MKKVKKARPAPNFDKLHTNWQKSFQQGKACSKKICTQVQEFDLTKPGTKFTPAKASTDLLMSEDDTDNVFYESEYQSLKKTMEAKQATMDSYIPSTVSTTGARRKILTDLETQQNFAKESKSRTPSLVEEQQEQGDIPFESDAGALTSILKDMGIVSTTACQRIPVRHTMAVGSKRVATETMSQRHSMAQHAGCSWTCDSELYRRSIYYQPSSNQSLKEMIEGFNKCHEGSRNVNDQDQGRPSAKKSSKTDMQFMSNQSKMWNIDSPFNHGGSVVRLRSQSRILRTPENDSVPARRVVTSTKRHGTICRRMSSSTSKKVQKTLRWAEILREEDGENQVGARLASTLQFCDQIPGSSSAVSAAAIGGDSARSPRRWMTHTTDTSPQTTVGHRPLRVKCSNRAGTSPQRAEGQHHGGGGDRMKLQVLTNKERELEREIGAIEMTLEAEESLHPDLPMEPRVSVTGQRARLSPSSNNIAAQSRQRDRLSPSSNAADPVLKLAQKKRRSVQDLSQVLHEVGEYNSQLNNRANILKEQDQNVDSDRILKQIQMIQSQQKGLRELQSELEEQLIVEQRKELGVVVATSNKFRNLNIEENNNGCARGVDMISDSQNNLTTEQESLDKEVCFSKDMQSTSGVKMQQNTEPLCDITHHQNMRTKISIVLDRSQISNNNNNVRQNIMSMAGVEPELGSQVEPPCVSEDNGDSFRKSPPNSMYLTRRSARDHGLLSVSDSGTNVTLPLDLSTKKVSEKSSAETHSEMAPNTKSCKTQEYLSPFVKPRAKQKLEFSTTKLSPTVGHALIPRHSPNSAFSNYSGPVKADEEVIADTETCVPPISTPLSKRIEARGNGGSNVLPTELCTDEIDVQPATNIEKANIVQNVTETVPESLEVNTKPNLKIVKSGFSSRKKRANEDRLLDDILLKRALKCSAERFHEALLDDEVTLFACRLQSSLDVSSSADRGFTNPIATTLDRGDDYHFVPI